MQDVHVNIRCEPVLVAERLAQMELVSKATNVALDCLLLDGGGYLYFVVLRSKETVGFHFARSDQCLYLFAFLERRSLSESQMADCSDGVYVFL